MREYINSSAHLSRAPETQLLKGRRRQRWTIKKVHGTGAAILAGFSVGSVKWAMEATNDLRELLTERLETKTAKYKHLSEKKILLLVDSYLYVDWEHWVTASTVVAGKAFHTVAVVSSVFGCRVIRSENERWQRLHNIGLSGHCRSAER